MEMRRLASATIAYLLTPSAVDAPVIDLDPLIRAREHAPPTPTARGYSISAG
jgi:hypothetical protein